MKCGGGNKNEEKWWTRRCILGRWQQFSPSWSAADWPVADALIFFPLELSRFLNKELERVNQRVWEDKKKTTCLQEDSCLQHTVGFIMQEPRLPARPMLCQSVLRHLRHIGSVMKSVEKRGIWQKCARNNVLPQVFCFPVILTGTLAHQELWICLNIW